MEHISARTDFAEFELLLIFKALFESGLLSEKEYRQSIRKIDAADPYI